MIYREKGLKSQQPSTDRPHSGALGFYLSLCPYQFSLLATFTAVSRDARAQLSPRTAAGDAARTSGDIPPLSSFSAASPTAVPGSLLSLKAYRNWHTPVHGLKHHSRIYTPSKEPQQHPSLHGQAPQVTYQHWRPGEGLCHKQAPTSSTFGVFSVLSLH